jgi:serine protease Do
VPAGSLLGLSRAVRAARRLGALLVAAALVAPSPSLSQAPDQVVAHIKIYSGSQVIEEGSGFLITPNGFIVTARHVLKEALSSPTAQIKVSLRFRGNNELPAAIFQCSPGEFADVCIIKVNSAAPGGSGITQFAKIACKELDSGTEVKAYGYDGAQGNTVLNVPGVVIGGVGEKFLYPSTLPLTYGMSGGPVLDRGSGHVVGVVKGGARGGTHGYFTPIVQAVSLLLAVGVSCPAT